MSENNKVNINIGDSDIETSKQKKNRDLINAISTVCVVLSTVVLVIAIVISASSYSMNKRVEAAPTSEEMLSSVNLYGIEYVSPFDIVEDVASYNAHEKKKEDKNISLAIGLAEYREAALYKYAYEYVGDAVAVDKYSKIMEAARNKMQVNSYADTIDKSYESFSSK